MKPLGQEMRHCSPPGASGVHDAAPSHGLADKSIRPNQHRSNNDPVETGVAILLAGCIAVELYLFAAVIRSII